MVSPPPRTARRLLYVVDAHLSLGDLDAAVGSAYRAVDLLGILPPPASRTSTGGDSPLTSPRPL
ncbi:hypothetical protein GCM10010319_23670 [Streptomyces blastmyceticus]|uniref:Uncharacterized protein n=1 Tax=Streptomyces blastmyceticus TaxID=68180 RepID=A0ABP3GLW2_9ACTN